MDEVRKEGREGVRASQCLCAAVETVEGETRKDKGPRRREETHRTQGSAWYPLFSTILRYRTWMPETVK